MQRNFWIFALVFLAVLAVVVLWRGRPTLNAPFEAGRLLQVYSVPAERGETIRDSLRTVLMATREGGEPLGHASLPTPTQLLVSAPASMQSSIRRAVNQLTEGAPVAAPSPARAVAVELWVVGVSAEPGDDDPALQPAATALAQARSTFGTGRFELLDRSLVVGVSDGGGALGVETESLNSSFVLQSIDPNSVRAAVRLELGDRREFRPRFHSVLTLPDGQWQVIGLLNGREENAPDRLLLMRQTRVGVPPASPAAS